MPQKFFTGFFTKISGALLFWWAFVLTRSFETTFGDKLIAKGGINFITVAVLMFFYAILIYSVAREMRRKKERVGNERNG